MAAEMNMQELTEEELKTYDRQIRMWGLEGQKRMRGSSVLFWSLDGCNSEILKNIVLAGVGTVTIVEDGIVTKQNTESHFYLAPSHIGRSWAEVAVEYFTPMNPRVEFITCSREEFQSNPEAINQFTVVTVANEPLDFQKNLSLHCREANIPYFYSRSCGTVGFAFADAIEYSYKKKWAMKDGITEDREITTTWCDFDAFLTGRIVAKRRLNYFANVIFTIQALESLPVVEHTVEAVSALVQERASATNTKLKELNTDLITNCIQWYNVNLSMTNTLLGGYLANSVLCIVQQDTKRRPFLNSLACDIYRSECIQLPIGISNDK